MIYDSEHKQRDSSHSEGTLYPFSNPFQRAGVKSRHHILEQWWRMWSKWLNRAGKPWSVREEGVALEGSQR